MIERASALRIPVSNGGAKKRSCLVVGHGSVGANLAGRANARGDLVLINDREPRVPVAEGTALAPSTTSTAIDCVMSCVNPDAAEDVPEAVRSFVGHETLYFDWNSVSPGTKRRVASLLTCSVIDVALLDSIGGIDDVLRVVISGPKARQGRSLLASYGIKAEIAGDEVGAAALLKYTRSIFMKSLEALVLEYVAAGDSIDEDQIVWRSLQRNLGPRFMRFIEVLVATNRLHAQRRAAELADAVEVFQERQIPLRIAPAAVDVLTHATAMWDQEGAPSEYASVGELSSYIRSWA